MLNVRCRYFTAIFAPSPLSKLFTLTVFFKGPYTCKCKALKKWLFEKLNICALLKLKFCMIRSKVISEVGFVPSLFSF